MRIERRDDVVLVIGGPVPPGADAITLGRYILVRPGSAASPRLLAHERVHVEQWRRWGVVGFLARYLGAYARWRLRGYPHRAAYRRIPFEVEAEWRARRGEGPALPPSPGEG
ncbi:MAG: DUF4157 domain-containing protein [Acidimicrobiia bacterium]